MGDFVPILIYTFAWLDSNFSGTFAVRVNILHYAGVPAFTTLSKYRCNRAGRHADRQTLSWWVAQSAECKRTKKTKERKWTFIRGSRTDWMKVRRLCRMRSHLLLRCKKEIISIRKCFTWRSCLLLRLEPRWHKLNVTTGADGMALTGKMNLLRRNPVVVRLCPQHISHRLAWIRTWASVTRGYIAK